MSEQPSASDSDGSLLICCGSPLSAVVAEGAARRHLSAAPGAALRANRSPPLLLLPSPVTSTLLVAMPSPSGACPPTFQSGGPDALKAGPELYLKSQTVSLARKNVCSCYATINVHHDTVSYTLFFAHSRSQYQRCKKTTPEPARTTKTGKGKPNASTKKNLRSAQKS